MAAHAAHVRVNADFFEDRGHGWRTLHVFSCVGKRPGRRRMFTTLTLHIGGGGGEGEKLDSYVEYRDRNKISTFPSPHKKMVTENCKFSLFERYAPFLSA